MDCEFNELYPCLLGESLDAGLAAALVRLSGCNLDCSYCDTIHARREDPEVVPVEALVDRIVRLGLPRALITGGEPLLQKEAVVKLSRLLLEQGLEVMLETNGTISLADVPAGVVKVVDVKTPGAEAGMPFLEENVSLLTPRDQLKFVICDWIDYEWTVTFASSLRLPFPSSSVLLSPAAGSLKAGQLAEWMLNERSPYRFHLQMHKTVWGDRRGV
jgi:7-carboxy-7-deazaguanine synthase